MKYVASIYTALRKEFDTLTFLFFLILIEAIGIYVDLRTSVIYNWIPILTPLIWIDVSFIFIYLFLKGFFLNKAPNNEDNYLVTRYFKPNYRNLSKVLRYKGVRILLIVSTASYFIIYSFIQGMFLIDIAGSIEPRFNIVPTIIGYGPVLIIAPSNYFMFVITPYLLTAALTLSIFSGLAITLLTVTFISGRKVRKMLPTPLLGLAVVCPTCILNPFTAILFSTISVTSTLVVSSIPAQTLIFTLSTTLLITTLILLWISISVLSKIPVNIKTDNG